MKKKLMVSLLMSFIMDVSYNKIGKLGVEALLKNTHIEELNIKGNPGSDISVN